MTDKNKKTIEAYDKNPQFYADRFDSYGVRIEDVDRALKLNKSNSRKVLELGCANGRDAEYIVSKVGKENYVGIDASEGLIKLAREKIPQAMFQVKDMRDVSLKNGGQAFETGSLGVVISFATMLHVNRDEMPDIIDKCHNILKIGGILYIGTKFGEYRELEIENLGEKKYYYSYKPADIKKIAGNKLETVFEMLHDSDYGPFFSIALRKI